MFKADVDSVLPATLLRVIDFNKFAEAKNAALLTFASAWILGITNLLSAGKPIPFGLDVALTMALPLFTCSALVSMYSFIPLRSITKFDKSPIRRESLLFFGELATLTGSSLLQMTERRYLKDVEKLEDSEYHNDLAGQIVFVSKIVQRKLKFFEAAAIFTLSAIGLVAAVMAFAAWHGA